jgi:hypothetical protein
VVVIAAILAPGLSYAGIVTGQVVDQETGEDLSKKEGAEADAEG